MYISEVSFYWRQVHVSKYTSSLYFYSTAATATAPLNMTYMLPHFNFCFTSQSHVACPYGLDGQYRNSFFLH